MMSQRVIDAGVTILLAIVGVALLAVLVSQRSQTAGVLTASAGGFRDALCAALSPLGVECGSSRSLTPNVNSRVIF